MAESHLPNLVTITVPSVHASAVLAFANRLVEGDLPPTSSMAPLPGVDYATACSAVSQSICTSFELRRRLASDNTRDPVDALRDAELLYSLQRQRVSELLGPNAV